MHVFMTSTAHCTFLFFIYTNMCVYICTHTHTHGLCILNG